MICILTEHWMSNLFPFVVLHNKYTEYMNYDIENFNEEWKETIRITSNIEFQESYESLSNRIQNYAEQNNNDENEDFYLGIEELAQVCVTCDKLSHRMMCIIVDQEQYNYFQIEMIKSAIDNYFNYQYDEEELPENEIISIFFMNVFMKDAPFSLYYKGNFW